MQRSLKYTLFLYLSLCESDSDPSCYDSTDSDGIVFQTLSELNASVPPPRLKEEAGYLMQCGVLAARSGAPLVVIDDDPTVASVNIWGFF